MAIPIIRMLTVVTLEGQCGHRMLPPTLPRDAQMGVGVSAYTTEAHAHIMVVWHPGFDMPPQLSLAVVGAQHANVDKRAPTRRFAIDLCRPGDPVELRPEPKNPADPYAIAVHNHDGMQMGYLTADRAPWIGGMIRNGREIACIFQESTQYGAVIRVGFDGAAPVLPPARAPVPDEPDFYPDEEWPDE